MITKRELEKELSHILSAFRGRKLEDHITELEELYNRYLLKLISGKWSWSFSPDLAEESIGVVVISGEVEIVWPLKWKGYFGEYEI